MQSSSRTTVVLDAWPVVEHFMGLEPSYSQVTELYARRDGDVVINVVNYVEVRYGIARESDRKVAERFATDLREAAEVLPVSEEVLHAATWLKYGYHLSVADAFAAATAMLHDAPLWTGDEELVHHDRVWQVNDLRDPALRDKHASTGSRRPLGIRPDVLGGLTPEEIKQWILGPVNPAVGGGWLSASN